jgi:acyl-CoA synthetase (AMP-forming)/AMP-acid ligase II/esterase/lipase
MSGNPDFRINEPLYQWCVRAFSLLRHRLGINIKVHDADGHIKAGQIFLFNHFTRIETIIPQYFIYQATGSYCRCVAAHKLFLRNERFAKLLWSCGAVPSTHPGLLAFLAAEILRGRKVIFFPEGRMIKDRYVAATEIDSPAAPKHRQGAAALALVLESFKKRIISVHEAGETDRLERWVHALGLKDIDELIAAARQPTLIIPANITFNPIHTGDNVFRKAAELFGRDISEDLKAELLIESNLVFKRTDMDIRFGKPIHPDVTWTLWDEFVLRQVFAQIHSLEELFALKDMGSRWTERMLAMTMRRKTQQLRDLCMAEMYAHVTVNLNHIVSRLILVLLKLGTSEMERQRFHRLLYLAFKNVQKEPSIALHRSLTSFDYYDGLHDGTSRLITQFFDAAIASGLVEANVNRYRFLPTLRQQNGQRDPRLENIVVVYANEIAPVAAACRAIDAAIRDEPMLNGPALARLLFDDELRAFVSSKSAYAQRRFSGLNDQESASESGEPYLLYPSSAKNLGIVLIHDFLSSPAELKNLGQRFAELGYPVLGLRIKGHGTSPWDLRERSWQDWLSSVRAGHKIMSHLVGNVCLIGSSAGGSLALLAAAEKPKGLIGIAAVSPPLRFRNRQLAFVPVLHGINRLTEWTYAEEGLMPFRIYESEQPRINYRHVPIRGLFELRRMAEEMERRLPDVTCPVKIIQATEDPIVDPESAVIIHDRIGSTVKSLDKIVSRRHGLLNEDVGDSQSLVIGYVHSLTSSLGHKEWPPAAKEDAARDRSFKDGQALPKLNGTMPHYFERVLRRFRRARAAKAQQPNRVMPWEKSYPETVSWKMAIEPRPLTSLIDDAVRTYADRICMSFRGKHYRYREVGRLVDRAAKGFQELGVGKGIKVGLMLPNTPYAVVCFYGILKAGGTVVNINPLYSATEIEGQIADSGCRILVTLDIKGLYEKASGFIRENGQIEKLLVCRMKGVLRFSEKVAFGLFKGGDVASISEDDRHITFERLIANEGIVKMPPIDAARDVAVLQYTGGTTGLPKAAQLTHANLYTNAVQLSLWAPDIRLGEEKSVAVLPLFHSFGMTAVMNLSILIGAEMILLARFVTAEVLETIKREKPTIFIGVPTMYSALLGPRDLAKHDLSSLRVCISGGAALPSEIQRRFETVSGCKLIEGYGLSEASPVCTINPLKNGKAGSVGLPLPGTLIEIVSMENPDRVLGTNERGEICVTGPQVMAGYANRAKENIDVFRGARLHTGDVGYLDEDGYLYIVDRIKELIISGGFNVYPRHVEEVIHFHPAVEEVAVCGVPDPHRGESVKAFVKLREGHTLTAAELRDFCREKLAPFQLPRHIEFRDELPKTLIGKISKKDLLAQVVLAEPELIPSGGV